MKKTLGTLILISGIITLNQSPSQASGSLWEHKMGEIINSYLKIRSQLAADSLEGVGAEAWNIAKASEAIQEIISSISHDARLQQFHSQVDVQTIAKHAKMLHGQDIEAVRKHFKPLSEPIRKYVELFGKPENVAGEVYIYHCPMYPGDWLQKDKNTGNPYYGKKMLKCGNLVGESSSHKAHEHKHYMEGMEHKH